MNIYSFIFFFSSSSSSFLLLICIFLKKLLLEPLWIIMLTRWRRSTRSSKSFGPLPMLEMVILSKNFFVSFPHYVRFFLHHAHTLFFLKKLFTSHLHSNLNRVDIDYIAIKSDTEAEGEGRDANSRKAYHYRAS